MASEILNTPDIFVETANKLLSEYTGRLFAKKQEIDKILERYHQARAKPDTRSSIVEVEHLRRRYDDEFHDFMMSRETFAKLIRKTSQWLEHGKSPQPHLELELEVRLADLENTFQSMQRYFDNNRI